MQHRQLKEEVVAANFAPEEFEENKQPPALRGAFEAVKVDASSKRFWHGPGMNGPDMNPNMNPNMNGNDMFCTSGCSCTNANGVCMMPMCENDCQCDGGEYYLLFFRDISISLW